MNAEHLATPVVLALDTSTPVLSAAVARLDGVFERSVEAGRHTGALVPSVVADVLAESGSAAADLTAIAVGVGPGPYTSLRAGIMFAEAAALALEIPVIGACSLDITARGLVREQGGVLQERTDDFIVAADARRRELYWSRYSTDGRRLAGPQVDPRAGLETGWAELGVTVAASPPSAADLAVWVLAEYVDHNGILPPLAATPEQWAAPTNDAAELQIPQSLLEPRPLYLRRPDAVEPVAATAPVNATAPVRATSLASGEPR